MSGLLPGNISCMIHEIMAHTISENVYAGNAMNRRLFYQYGILLPA